MSRFRVLRGCLAAWVLVMLGSCGGGSGPGPTAGVAASGDVPAACSTAFDGPWSDGLSKLAPMFRALSSPEDAVALSQCPMDGARNVTIGEGGCGPRVVIDKSFVGESSLGKITIKADGKLAVPRVFDQLEVRTAGISVAGLLSVGTAACPVGSVNPDSRIKIVFTGDRADDGDAVGVNTGSTKGIEVSAGGVLRLFGAKGVVPAGVSWTHLSQPAGPIEYQRTDAGIGVPVDAGGERTIRLDKDVSAGAAGTAWAPGDWIVVATSSFSPFESEFVQIESLLPDGAGGTTVTLVQPLRHYHFGGPDPGLPSEQNFGAGREINFGVDERSEVGLISRHVMLTAETPDPAQNPEDPNLHWGGEIRILEGFAEASIQGVELEKFGKERIGSYPIHFHMTGDASGRHLIDSNSIHHSYNKCITLHSTSGVSVRNNVCARAIGHLFYQEMGDEQNISFIGNLGVGAMSHYFGIDVDAVPKAFDGRVKNWWEGDYLARENGYDGLNVRNTDRQDNPTHGRCFAPVRDGSGRLTFRSEVPCQGDSLYVEQATGFWIVKPATVIEGNSIAGCQGMGKGYWYVPPQDVGGRLYPQRFQPVGSFVNNRVHACYDGLFGETDIAAVSQQLFPTVGGRSTGELDALNLIAHFRGFTATRIRNRGVWMRPMWTAVEDGRFATNRDSVSLVSSGGNDGNAPGVWALLKDSVLVGISTNNVDRWGPCPRADAGDGPGCVDMNPRANELFEHGYQTPRWNSAGYMIYDGPVRIVRDHFVNYLRDIDSLLTHEDQDTLNKFVAYPQPALKRYEGDAALGWFQNNQSAYPTATVSRELSFDNVDLRHQIYSDKVNLGDFRDGDKNTALIDLDGTLSGYKVVDAAGQPVRGQFPISLNNVPFNRSSNAVDECLSTGQQDEDVEDRATSIMSPASMATLEFEAHAGGGSFWQDVQFTKDSLDAGVHQSMTLQGRNGQGIWEPKVASGHGYTIKASATSAPGQSSSFVGIPPVVRLGFTDAVKPDMASKPFHVRVGICYSNKDGSPPAGNFTVSRGYKSWGGNGVSYNNPSLQTSFNFLSNRYRGQNCFNLDNQNPANLVPGSGCPAEGIVPVPAGGACPAGSALDATVTPPVCVFPRKTLSAAGGLGELTRPDGTPAALDKYFYDAHTGMLFFYVVQDVANASGVAPLGSCPGDSACPDELELETFYSCPPQGCINYSVQLDDPGYNPGPSRCDERAGGSIYNDPSLVLPEPADANRLAYVGGSGGVVSAVERRSAAGLTHWIAATPPSCPVSVPPAPAAVATKSSLAPAVPRDVGPNSGRTALALMRQLTPDWLDWSPRPPVTDLELLARGQVCTAAR